MSNEDTASPPAPIAGQKRPRESSSPPAGANGVANGGAGGSNGRPVKRGRTSFFAPIYDDTESESDSAAAPSQARPINRPVRARLSLTASARRSLTSIAAEHERALAARTPQQQTPQNPVPQLTLTEATPEGVAQNQVAVTEEPSVEGQQAPTQRLRVQGRTGRVTAMTREFDDAPRIQRSATSAHRDRTPDEDEEDEEDEALEAMIIVDPPPADVSAMKLARGHLIRAGFALLAAHVDAPVAAEGAEDAEGAAIEYLMTGGDTRWRSRRHDDGGEPLPPPPEQDDFAPPADHDSRLNILEWPQVRDAAASGPSRTSTRKQVELRLLRRLIGELDLSDEATPSELRQVFKAQPSLWDCYLDSDIPMSEDDASEATDDEDTGEAQERRLDTIHGLSTDDAAKLRKWSKFGTPGRSSTVQDQIRAFNAPDVPAFSEADVEMDAIVKALRALGPQPAPPLPVPTDLDLRLLTTPNGFRFPSGPKLAQAPPRNVLPQRPVEPRVRPDGPSTGSRAPVSVDGNFRDPMYCHMAERDRQAPPEEHPWGIAPGSEETPAIAGPASTPQDGAQSAAPPAAAPAPRTTVAATPQSAVTTAPQTTVAAAAGSTGDASGAPPIAQPSVAQAPQSIVAAAPQPAAAVASQPPVVAPQPPMQQTAATAQAAAPAVAAQPFTMPTPPQSPPRAPVVASAAPAQAQPAASTASRTRVLDVEAESGGPATRTRGRSRAPQASAAHGPTTTSNTLAAPTTRASRARSASRSAAQDASTAAGPSTAKKQGKRAVRDRAPPAKKTARGKAKSVAVADDDEVVEVPPPTKKTATRKASAKSAPAKSRGRSKAPAARDDDEVVEVARPTAKKVASRKKATASAPTAETSKAAETEARAERARRRAAAREGTQS